MAIFSISGKERGATLLPAGESYEPYTEAWKEFDKLQKSVSGHGTLNWTHWVLGFLVSFLGLFGTRRPSRDSVVLLLFWGGLAAVQLLRVQALRNRFLHWQCPRCHAEWPGTKTEKDDKCVMCGLRLHQMAP